MKTLADRLKEIGADKLPGADLAASIWFQDIPMTPFKVTGTEGTGALQLICGGLVVMASYPDNGNPHHVRGACYITIDRSEYIAWQQRGGLQGNAGKAAPFEVLRVAIGA